MVVLDAASDVADVESTAPDWAILSICHKEHDVSTPLALADVQPQGQQGW